MLATGMGVFLTASGQGVLYESAYSLSAPTIDGNFNGGEWSDANVIDFSTVSGNMLNTLAYFKNNDTHLFICYDVRNDETEGSMEGASFAFDTDNNDAYTEGEDDQFVIGNIFGGLPEGSAHYVIQGGFPNEHCKPMDDGTIYPDHAGLEGAQGFGPSPNKAINHRIYEIAIPLSLLGVNMGDIVGFACWDDWFFQGILDDDAFMQDTFPEAFFVPIERYADLLIGYVPLPVDVLVYPDNQTNYAPAGEYVLHTLNVSNRGTSGTDTINLDFEPGPLGWTGTFYDEDGITPLVDTDGDPDGFPDTGPLNTGVSRTILVNVSIPVAQSAGDTDVATVWCNTSNTPMDSEVVNVTSVVSDAYFSPPHSDYLVDSDGDLTADYLVIRAWVQNDVDQSYYLRGYLWDSTKSVYLGEASNWTNPGLGLNFIELRFDSYNIYNSGIDGPYFVEMELRMTNWPDYDIIDRDQHWTGPHLYTDFDPTQGKLSPPHEDFGNDTDGDSYYNVLVVNVSVEVSTEGDFRLDSTLYDSRGWWIDSYQNITYLYPGIQQVQLFFDGLTIRLNAAEGNFNVTLTLRNETGLILLDQGWHITGYYYPDDFELPNAYMVPPHEDFGNDTNANTWYDSLTVNITVQVDYPGDYRLTGDLWSDEGWWVTWTENVTFLNVGLQVVQLFFDGVTIYASGQNGYGVDLWLYNATTFQLLNRSWYDTTPYTYDQFERGQGYFDPPHEEFANDTDGNSKYETLTFNASVYVKQEGDFRLDGWLRSGVTWIDNEINVTYLTTGNQQIQLFFDGPTIWRSGLDGPYEIEIWLRNATTFDLLDQDIYTTAAYSYEDFEKPQAYFTPPHTYFGNDTNANTLYDTLTVNASVYVKDAGDYRVRMWLNDVNGAWIGSTENISFLPAGPNEVQLYWMGNDLYTGQHDGPYWVRLWAYNQTTGDYLHYDEFYTIPYDYWEFEHAPTVTLITPDASEFIMTSFANNIQWTASIPLKAVDPVTIEYSDDAGSTWQEINGGVYDKSDDGVESWTPPADGVAYLVRVTVEDPGGATASDTSTFVFSVDSLAAVEPDAWHFQVEMTTGNYDLNMMPVEPAAATSTVGVSAAGDYLIETLETNWTAAAGDSLGTDPWTFEVYGYVTDVSIQGFLYAKVYNESNYPATPMFTTVLDNEDVTGFVGAGNSHMFSWSHTPAGQAIPPGDSIIVEMWLGATAGSVGNAIDRANNDYIDAALNEGEVFSGTLANVNDGDNDVYYQLRETETGGNPANRFSQLGWIFEVPVTGGTDVTFYVQAYHDLDADGDDFRFQYSTAGNNGPWTNMLTVTATSDPGPGVYQPYSDATLDAFSGTLYLRVIDTDWTVGANNYFGSIWIDDMYVESTGGFIPDFVMEYDSYDRQSRVYATPFPLVSRLPPGAATVTDMRLAGVGYTDIQITFDASPDDGGGTDTVTEYRIYRSTNGGPYVLRDSVPATDSPNYVWTDVNAGDGDYNFYNYTIRAYNGQTSAGTVEHGKTVRHLIGGQWRLISIPLALYLNNRAAVFATLDVKAIQAYDNMNKEWKTWQQNKPSHMETFNAYMIGEGAHRMGFWVKTNSDDYLINVGKVCPSDVIADRNINLYTGWNLVGYPTFTAETVGNAMSGLGVNYKVKDYDSGSPYRLKNLPDADMMYPGRGYWIWVDADTVWTVDW